VERRTATVAVAIDARARSIERTNERTRDATTI